ncbi:hypothetical protein CC79DRAFT_1361957 [Sarocladium strictum]
MRIEELPSQCTPATLNFDGRLVKVFIEASNNAVAILLSSVLQELVRDFALILTATVCTKRQKVFREHGDALGLRKQHSINPSLECSLRIIVYGFRQQMSDIGKILADNNHFLQHPGETEFDRQVEYINPQYLLPPGQAMPAIEQLSIYRCCNGRDGQRGSRSDVLGEGEKAEVFSIFNAAYQNIATQRYATERPNPVSGGILADEMGLGKSLSALSLICYSLDQYDEQPALSQGAPRATLIITPKSTIYGWEKQLKSHIRADQVRWMTYYGPKRKLLEATASSVDIVLTTYETVASDQWSNNPQLYEQTWARVFLDEAHRIRNSESKLFSTVLGLKAVSRWCLTGTPIQNSLDDFGSLLAFVRVPGLETQEGFKQFIKDPLEKDRKLGLKLLRKVVAATCLRRTKANTAALQLPRKMERTESIEMTRSDRYLYTFFKSSLYQAARGSAAARGYPRDILILISILRQICNHGEALLPPSALAAWNARDKSALTWETLETGSPKCITCNIYIEELNLGRTVTREFQCGHVICENCDSQSQPQSQGAIDISKECSFCDNEGNSSQASSSKIGWRPESGKGQTSQKAYPAPSVKIRALLRNLEKPRNGGNEGRSPAKSVVFSFWTKMLDLIEAALKTRGILYCRIDGQSSMHHRMEALDTFQSGSQHNVMLASISAAGEGIDLTAANSIHIIEPHWNPMAEAQAIDRVHRIGQQADVEVVRYIVRDSIEMYIQWVQNYKLRLITDSLSSSAGKDEIADDERFKELLKYLE